jgi:hypothetical protein
MNGLLNQLDKEKFITKLFNELSKLPFGSLPKSELELVILHSIIESKGGYGNLNKIMSSLQRDLKLSQAKFKKKVFEAQIRFDNQGFDVSDFLREQIIEKEILDLVIEDNYLVISISNPLHLDIIKTFFDSNEILNDTSFNKNILKIQTKGLLKILMNILDKNELKKIDTLFKKEGVVKNNAFSLIGDVKVEKLIGLDFSLDVFSSMDKFLGLIRKALNLFQ